MERLNSVKANKNFDYELRGAINGRMNLFVLRVSPDSAENFVVFIRTQKVLDAFYRYLLCFRYRCFKDDQPIFFQGQGALSYDYASKVYTDNKGNHYFSRKSLMNSINDILICSPYISLVDRVVSESWPLVKKNFGKNKDSFYKRLSR